MSAFRTIVETLYAPGAWRESYLRSEQRWEDKKNPWHAYGKYRDFSVASSKGKAHAMAFLDSRLLEKPARCGLIGRIEATNPEAFHAVLFGAESWLQKQGCRHIISPVDWTVWHRHRFFVKGEMPTAFEPHNPEWYPRAMMSAGYAAYQEYMTAQRSDIAGLMDIIAPALKHVQAAGIEIVRLQPEELSSALPAIYDVTRQSFEDSTAYIPISIKEFSYLYEPTVNAASTALMYIARDGQHVAGYLFAFHDPERPSALLMKTVAVTPAYQRRHVAIALAALAHQEALVSGCTTVEYLLVRVGNNVSTMPYSGVQPIRRFQNFVKSV